MPTKVFECEAVLFDMDGTLTDSIAAVEAAWGKVARDIGQDPQAVIAATHGKRAIDNLAMFKPQIKAADMESEVQAFEETILYFADAYNLHGPGSRVNTPKHMTPVSATTPWDSPAGSRVPSRANSMVAAQSRRPSFGAKLAGMLQMSAAPVDRSLNDLAEDRATDGDEFAGGAQHAATFDDEEDDVAPTKRNARGETRAEMETRHRFEAWQIEAQSVDRGVQILPGVKRMMNSIPAGRYAVATSGAKTYAYGCMTRVGITPPPVTITADDKRLKAGKPAPDPFLLAAKELGFAPETCVVFEDSPSGIRAGVAAGCTVIALCTSHSRSKIENCGAHYLVENMDNVICDVVDGKLRFTVTE